MLNCISFFILQYADPVADLLDKWDVFNCRLFRESCVFHRGNYVKDLSRLGRELHKIIIVDNSPASYVFHPDNAVSVQPKKNLVLEEPHTHVNGSHTYILCVPLITQQLAAGPA
jgi:hypothetical protein